MQTTAIFLSYLPFLGQHDVRQAAAAHVSRMSGVSYNWLTQCIITAAVAQEY
jgi:hypothetical protein